MGNLVLQHARSQDLSETFKVPTKFIGATLLPILGIVAGGWHQRFSGISGVFWEVHLMPFLHEGKQLGVWITSPFEKQLFGAVTFVFWIPKSQRHSFHHRFTRVKTRQMWRSFRWAWLYPSWVINMAMVKWFCHGFTVVLPITILSSNSSGLFTNHTGTSQYIGNFVWDFHKL